ncbi:hypothetical protein MBLNU230_g2888t1 [Neophaeotheca triangularis]
MLPRADSSHPVHHSHDESLAPEGTDEYATANDRMNDDENPPEEIRGGTASITVAEFMRMEKEHEDVDESAYMLRSNARYSQPGKYTTYVDKDTTGDYDPEVERRGMLRRRRTNKSQTNNSARKDANVDSTSHKREAFLPPPELIVTLRLCTPAAKAELAACLIRSTASTSKTTEECYKGYGLRNRVRNTTIEEQDNSSDLLPEDLTGHPVARGCYACASLALTCPLLNQSELTWPCETCEKDGNECQLLVEPVEKTACERCKRLKQKCSFTITTNHKGPCKGCKEDDTLCIAGPTKAAAATRVRLTYDRDYTVFPLTRPPKFREMKSCKQCQDAERECSYDFDDHDGPCTACEMDEMLCERDGNALTAEDSDEKARKKKKKKGKKSKGKSSGTWKRKDNNPDADETEPWSPQHLAEPFPTDEDAVMEDVAEDSNKAAIEEKNTTTRRTATRPVEPVQTKTIKTRFCHPIIFDHDINSECSFCRTPTYSFLGIAPRTPTVKDLPFGNGYEEISNGHSSEGRQQTTLCTVCTHERAGVVACETHDFRMLPIAQMTDVARTTETQWNILRTRSCKPKFWCSICCNMASYECCAIQDDQRLVYGCGLLLCQPCRIDMRAAEDDFQGFLDRLEGVGRTVQRPRGLRADWELYKSAPRGLLARFLVEKYQAQAEAEGERMDVGY